jgi:hypothetical protein
MNSQQFGFSKDPSPPAENGKARSLSARPYGIFMESFAFYIGNQEALLWLWDAQYDAIDAQTV